MVFGLFLDLWDWVSVWFLVMGPWKRSAEGEHVTRQAVPSHISYYKKLGGRGLGFNMAR